MFGFFSRAFQKKEDGPLYTDQTNRFVHAARCPELDIDLYIAVDCLTDTLLVRVPIGAFCCAVRGGISITNQVPLQEALKDNGCLQKVIDKTIHAASRLMASETVFKPEQLSIEWFNATLLRLPLHEMKAEIGKEDFA